MSTINGPTMEAVDHGRIAKQRAKVYALMLDGQWRTLSEIAAITGYPEASISARLRDFRKARYGAHTVDRARRADPASGWWEYRLTLSNPEGT
jgi:hypothetical protein